MFLRKIILELHMKYIFLTFSIIFLEERSSVSELTSIPVTISIIRTPILNMSDFREISPLERYSGAMYPLYVINITSEQIQMD